jgi:predicted nucleotidyltransferase component of viral defense system
MDRDTLKDVFNFLSDKHSFRTAFIEKDYHLIRILNSINTNLSSEIVFKGGTLLNKAYLNYHRLSEDLDFSYSHSIDLSTRGKRSRAITQLRKQMPAFLTHMDLFSDVPEGEGFNNSTQYIFNIKYNSIIRKRQDTIKLEISLRQPIFLPIETVKIKHFYKNPFTGKDILPVGTVKALSLDECAAEKIKAAISRRKPAIRDFYDLGHFVRIGYDFSRPNFFTLVDKKLELDGFNNDYSHNLGLSDNEIVELKRIIQTDLSPMIRFKEKFNLDDVLRYFNNLFKNS